MANSIETEASRKLNKLEIAVNMCSKLGNIAPSLQPTDMSDFAYLSLVLGGRLEADFADLQLSLVKYAFPLIADVKTSSGSGK